MPIKNIHSKGLAFTVWLRISFFFFSFNETYTGNDSISIKLYKNFENIVLLPWHLRIMKSFSALPYCCFLVAKSYLTLQNPIDYSPPHSSIHGIFPGKNTEVGCHFLLQGISPTQRSNLSVFAASAGGCFTSEPVGKPEWPCVNS